MFNAKICSVYKWNQSRFSSAQSTREKACQDGTSGTVLGQNSGNIYLFEVRKTRKRCEICSKLTIKTKERRQ